MPTESVFDRLYRQSTVASASRAAATRQSSSRRRTDDYSTGSIINDLSEPIASSSCQQGEGSNFDAPNKPREEPVCQPQTKPQKPYGGAWMLASTSKYDSKSKSLDPQLLNVSSELYSFEQGHMDEHTFALKLIEAMFNRDHMRGKHWDYDPASAVKEESEDDGFVKFLAEKEATWDWKDIYSVASAKGTISFFSERHEIRVENYSYCAAG